MQLCTHLSAGNHLCARKVKAVAFILSTPHLSFASLLPLILAFSALGGVAAACVCSVASQVQVLEEWLPDDS